MLQGIARFRSNHNARLSLRWLGSRKFSNGELYRQFNALIDAGVLIHDPYQLRLAARLSRLQDVLRTYTPPAPPPSKPIRPAEPEEEGDMSEHEKKLQTEKWETNLAAYEGELANFNRHIQEALARTPKGLYIYGDVGTGKSMLMDLFFETCELPEGASSLTTSSGSSSGAKGPTSVVPLKRRVHFHQFMLEIHRRIHALKQEHLKRFGRHPTGKLVRPTPERDALRLVAAQVASEAHVLCFDEFQVTDVADALMMVGFFRELWMRGTVVVATSNRPPSELYLGGVNRPYFMPFIAELEARCAVYSMQQNPDLLDKAVPASGSSSGPGGCEGVSGGGGGGGGNGGDAVGPMAGSRGVDTEVSSASMRDYRQLAASQQVPGAYTVVEVNGDDEGEDGTASSLPLRADSKVHPRLAPLFQALDCQSTGASSSSSSRGATQVPVMMGRTLAVPRGIPLSPHDNTDDDGAAAGGSGARGDEPTRQNPPTTSDDALLLLEGWCAWRFEELCEASLGASDYKALCDHFHTVVLSGVPKLTLKEHNQARRFVTLVDELYEHQVRLIVTSAAAPPQELFQEFKTGQPPPASAASVGLGIDRPGGPAAAATAAVNAPELSGRPVPSHLARGSEFVRVPLVAPERRREGTSTTHGSSNSISDSETRTGGQASAAAGVGAVEAAGSAPGNAHETVDAAQSTLVLEGELASVQELGFAFRRAASRLVEMGGAPYHRAHAKAWPQAVSLLV